MLRTHFREGRKERKGVEVTFLRCVKGEIKMVQGRRHEGRQVRESKEEERKSEGEGVMNSEGEGDRIKERKGERGERGR